MPYWIYENWQAGPHKAVLHESGCGLCKDGDGLSGGTNPAYGRWHGRFSSINDARDVMDRIPAVVKKEHSCV